MLYKFSSLEMITAFQESMLSKEMNHDSLKAKGGKCLQSPEMFSENTTVGSTVSETYGTFFLLIPVSSS